MQIVGNKDSEKSSLYTTSNSVVTCPSWWGSTGSYIPHSSFSKNLNLNMNTPTQASHQMKQPGQHLLDKDSSSTQSTGQSYQEAAHAMAGNTHERFISLQTGCEGTDTKRTDGHMKSVLTLGTPELIYSAPKAEYGQSVVQISYPYTDPNYSGIMPAYGQHAIIHPQMGTATTGRVPLPLELTEDGPIYVNAKQYRGILRRRQLRAKLEAQNKLVKGRKPYLHESRHLHAMKRIRGSGGRFLNTKELQQAQKKNQHQQSKCSALNTDGKSFSGSPTTASGSEVTSMSNNIDVFQLPDPLRFADFHSHMGGGMHRGMQDGISMMRSGSPQRIPVIR